VRLPLVGGTYQDRTINFNQERTVNLYAVISGSHTSENKYKLIGTPGRELFINPEPDSGFGGRGMHVTSDDRWFFVSGNTLFETDSFSLTATNRGNLNTFSGVVKMADNGTQLIIVDGTNGYIFNLSLNTLTQITDVNFPNGAKEVVYKDTYFITVAPNSGVIHISENNDGTTWSADLASVESNPDIVLGITTVGNEVLFFGSKTIEPWYNSGNPDFPLERVSSGIIDIGTRSRNSVAKIGNSVFFLGSNKDGYNVVYQLDGGQLSPVSDNAIEYQLNQSSYLTEAIAYTYQEDGSYFYILSIEDLDKTFAYDITTKLWHERASTNTDGTFSRHKSSFHAFWRGKNYVLDSSNNAIYRLGLDIGDDDGEIINRRRDLPVISSEGKWISFNRFELEIQPGIGTEVDGDGNESAPNIGLVISKDGGYTWGNELVRSAGMRGNYNTRVIWRNMGRSRSWVFSLRTSTRDPVCWIGINAEMAVGYA